MAMTACADEVGDQLDLLGGEGANLLTHDVYDPKELIVLEHRNREDGAKATNLDGGDAVGIPIEITRRCHHVREVDDPLRFCDAPKRGVRAGTDRRSLALLDQRGRRIVECDGTKQVSVTEVQ